MLRGATPLAGGYDRFIRPDSDGFI